MCAAKESRVYLSARSSTRCTLAANCSTASPLGITLAMRKSRSSKRRSVSDNSLRKAKDPDLVRLSTRSPGREGMPAKIPAVSAGAAAGALRGKRGGCGREEGGGWEEGAAAPLEALRALLWSSRIALRLLCGGCSQSCPNKSAIKTGHRWCQFHPPKQSKRADFCRARCCRLTHCASWTHGLLDFLMNALYLSNVPHSRETFSNVLVEEGCILVRRISGLDVL
jgi:hypothetical protein